LNLHLRHGLLAVLLAASAAWAAPPQLNLLVEMRAVQLPEPAAGATGGLTVDTRRGTPALRGDISLRTAREGDEAVEQVLVLNGGSASLRTSRLVPLATGEWLWDGANAGLAQTRQWLDVGRGFQVKPRWPGGDAAVTLDISAETAGRTAVQTTLAVPLGEWTPFARSGATTLQLRVSQPR